LLSGQVDFNFDNLATAAPNIRAGKLKALAVTTLGRSRALPDVPPVADTLKGFAIDTWWGLVAPAGTPRDVVQKLNAASWPHYSPSRRPAPSGRSASRGRRPVMVISPDSIT
jgi:tripartite-type tricarboxylate transporter receptor subunit TctC